MATPNPTANAPVTPPPVSGTVPRAKRSAPKRRLYDHAMSPKDKFALQAVLKARSGLNAAAVAIQEGKPINADLVKSCLEVQAACADLIFQG